MGNLNYKEYSTIAKDVDNNFCNLLLTREGAGKSLAAKDLVSRFRKIIFATETNNQAAEKAIGFEKLGLRVQLVKSRAFKLKELGIDPVIIRHRNPFKKSHLNEDKTFELIERKFGSSEAKKIWVNSQTDIVDLNPNKFDIIVLTFAQLEQIANFDNDVWVLFLDDPNRTSVQQIYVLEKQDKLEAVSKEFDVGSMVYAQNTTYNYCIRPQNKKLNYNIKIPQILTTTEEITGKLIQKNLGAIKIDLRKTNLPGNTYLIPTELTRKRFDRLIPILNHQINKAGFPTILIGDGLIKSDISHQTIKGNNQFTDCDTLIELSAPCVELVLPVIIEFPDLCAQKAAKMITLDLAHQAIGRNQGNRFRGNYSYVFIDTQFSKFVSENLDYKHTVLNPKDNLRRNLETPTLRIISEFLKDPLKIFEMKLPRSRYKTIQDFFKNKDLNEAELKAYMNYFLYEINIGTSYSKQIEAICNQILIKMNSGKL